jgi:uncharacterized protein YndB with AHSA1/START domain
MGKSLRKEAFYPCPPESVWTAITDRRAIAEWLMPNDFEPKVGHRFHFQVDPMPGWSNKYECEVVEVTPPKRLVYTWVHLPKDAAKPKPKPMTLTWELVPENGGTRLILVQTGIEVLGWWSKLSMSFGWGTMLGRWIPKVLKNVSGAAFAPGAIPLNRRCYTVRTVPESLTR